MNGPAPEVDFPVSHCARCGRDVLTHGYLDDGGAERRRCLHCDAEIDPRAIRWVLAGELDALGYDMGGDPGEGCGRPGCGKGNCASRQ